MRVNQLGHMAQIKTKPLSRVAGTVPDHAAPNWPLLMLVMFIPAQNLYLQYIPSFGAGLNFLNISVLLSVLVWRFRSDLAIPSPTPLHRPIYGYILIYVISVFYSGVTLGAIREGSFTSLKDLLIPIFLFFVVLNSVRDRRGVIWMITVTIIPLPYMFRVFHAQLQNVAAWHYADDLRLVGGTFMELGSNEIGGFYAAYTLVLISLFLFVKDIKARTVLIIAVALNLYCLLYSYSRGSWMGFLAGSAWIGWQYNRKWFVPIAVVLVIFSGTLINFLPVSVQERYDTIFVDKDEERDKSAESRFVLWGYAMTEYKKSPIIGIGYRAFPQLNPLGKDTHNYFVKVLTEQGALGLTFLLIILWRATKASRQLYRSSKDPLYRGLGLGMLGCLAALIVANLTGDRFTHYPLITYFWVYLALVHRCLQLVQENTPEEQRRPAIRK